MPSFLTTVNGTVEVNGVTAASWATLSAWVRKMYECIYILLMVDGNKNISLNFHQHKIF